MDEFENKINELGMELPKAPAAAGNYLPFRFNGNTLILAGVLASLDGEMTHTGKVGEMQTLLTGHEAAKVCALNAIASMRAALGVLDRVDQILLVSGYVNAVTGFTNSPGVINGASDLFVEVFGEAGKHARSAVSVSGLPRDSTVEIQVTLSFK
ncbi:MAG: RidA family protein [Verrucomicrobia bacterium]|nr:RidA family protein [Verrucomicrobiota bacterium]